MHDQFENRSTLRDYLAVIRRRRRILLQAVVLVPLVAVLASLMQEPRYAASSLALVNRQSLAATLTGAQDTNLLQDPELLGRTQAQIAHVPALAERVLRKAGVPNRSPSEFLASSSVKPVPLTDVVLSFTVSDRFPQVAERLATAYAQEYTRYRRELDTAAYKAALRQLQERMAKLRGSGVDTGSSFYASLLEKEQTLATLVALQVSNASVLRAANGAAQTSPRTLLNGVLGLFIGIVLGVSLAFLRETFDRRVRSDQSLDSIMSLPLLARVPPPPKHAARGELAMISRPSTMEAESFRLLRTNLELANLERRARTIMITSASRDEGKTTTIANLAVALARAGHRIALVDLDLRDPAIDQMFGLGERPGLSQVVFGEVPLTDALVRIPVAGIDQIGPAPTADLAPVSLHVLPVGSAPANPGEFVASDAITKILDELEESFDLVLIDAPPLLVVSDALALGGRVDAVLVVVRLNVTDHKVLDDLTVALNAVPCTKLGYVLTGAEPQRGYGPSSTTDEHPSDRRAKAPRPRAIEALESTPEAGSSRSRWA
jgi:capsular exopolysaccharide synthesis family protein